METNSAMLVTGFLPRRLKMNMAYGFEARWLELMRYPKGYNSGDAQSQAKVDLISDARQAYALGLIFYLPDWAVDHSDHVGEGNYCIECDTIVKHNTQHKESTGDDQQNGAHSGTSTHDDAPDNQRRAGRVGVHAG